MATYQRIPLKDLEVNPANDRHGELGSEAAAIEWLLVNKTNKMHDLLNDIINKKGITEEPLVMKKKGENKYIVYDGNRRVTCLKLLYGLAPHEINNPLAKRLEAIKSNNNIQPITHVDCRVEEDIDTINDILELRHIPGNSGAGQLKWDGHEKENFLERTGKSQKINFAREINKALIESGHLNPNDRIPLSTFNRLFSSKETKRRAGVNIADNKIQLINNKEIVYAALSRVAKDMIAGKKTLDDVWDNDKKITYLDELEKEGILPSAKNRLKKPKTIKQEDEPSPQPPKPSQGPHLRNYLLPTDWPTPKENEFFSAKFCILFYELQNTLQFNNHLIAISVAWRAFLEILTNTYLDKNELNEKGGLALKIQRAFEHMNLTKKMTETTRSFITKLSEENEYFSINMLHKVAHHDTRISSDDLRTFANNLDAYVRRAIENINS